MLSICSYLLCAALLVVDVVGLTRENGLRYDSRFVRGIDKLPRQITSINVTNITSINMANITSLVSSNPALDGLAVHIDPDADYASWFPSEDTFAKKKRTSKWRTFIQQNSLVWTNDTTGTNYNFTFSSCASRGNRVIGIWTYDNGTDNQAVTWFDILNDAKSVAHKYHSLNAALDAGIQRNIDALQYNITFSLGAFYYDDIAGAPPLPLGNTTQAGIDPVTAQDIINYDYNQGRNELRKLLQSDWLPTWEAVRFVAVGTALHYGIITGFNILANVATGKNTTVASHIYGAGAAVTFLSLAIAGWLVSPKFRSAINRMTASGVVANIREQGSRIANTALKRNVGDEESQTAQPNADLLSLPGTNDILSSHQVQELPGVDIDTIQVIKKPLSSMQRVGSWLSIHGAEGEDTVPFGQALEMVDTQSGSHPQC